MEFLIGVEANDEAAKNDGNTSLSETSLESKSTVILNNRIKMKFNFLPIPKLEEPILI